MEKQRTSAKIRAVPIHGFRPLHPPTAPSRLCFAVPFASPKNYIYCLAKNSKILIKILLEFIHICQNLVSNLHNSSAKCFIGHSRDRKYFIVIHGGGI